MSESIPSDGSRVELRFLVRASDGTRGVVQYRQAETVENEHGRYYQWGPWKGIEFEFESNEEASE